MGNYRFRLSYMMPNAWFYKLRDMNKTKNQTKKILPSPHQKPRKSYYHSSEKLYGSPKNLKAFDTHFPFDPPRKSTKNRTKRKTIYKPSPKKTTPSVSTNCICREPEYPVWLKPGTVHVKDLLESPCNFSSSPDQDFLEAPSSEFEYSDSFSIPHESLDEGNKSLSSSFVSSSTTDIIIDMEKSSYDTAKVKLSTKSKLISELGLRPILTRPAKVNPEDKSPNFKSPSTKIDKENKIHPRKNARTSSTSPASRRSVSRSRRVKVRGSTRNKIASKKTETRARKGMTKEEGMLYTESVAIVKSSLDPEQDFKDSMMEMIVENNIRASKDLEDLLACYLSLNCNQYHDLIIKAFEQIWFTIPQH